MKAQLKVRTGFVVALVLVILTSLALAQTAGRTPVTTSFSMHYGGGLPNTNSATFTCAGAKCAKGTYLVSVNMGVLAAVMGGSGSAYISIPDGAATRTLQTSTLNLASTNSFDSKTGLYKYDGVGSITFGWTAASMSTTGASYDYLEADLTKVGNAF